LRRLPLSMRKANLARLVARKSALAFAVQLETDLLEDTTLSDDTVLKLKEIVNLQASLWEAAQRLPEGSERLEALREIDRFQTRIAVFIRRLGSEALA
jgi:hypothetical protein